MGHYLPKLQVPRQVAEYGVCLVVVLGGRLKATIDPFHQRPRRRRSTFLHVTTSACFAEDTSKCYGKSAYRLSESI